MLFSLDICVNKVAPPTHSLHWALNTPPEKRYLFFFSFLPSPLLNFQPIQALPLFSRFTEKSFVEESVLFTFPYQANGNHVKEP